MALEPIDYTTHCHAIEEAFQKVVRAADEEIDWLILSPNGQKQYTSEKQGSGFGEFLGSFEDSKVEYGLARVNPPGSDVQKLVLVGWCPDNAPMKSRASFASNFGVVANQVLKSYHVQITARDEDDLDENELLAKVSNAAGARYSIQTQGPTKTTSAPKPRPSPVPQKNEHKKTVVPEPKATAPPRVSTPPASKPAPQATSAEDDWDEPEVQERDLRSNPLKPNQSTWKPVGKVDLQKLIAEEKSKQDPRLVNSVKSETPAKLNAKDDIEKLRKDSKAQRDAEINRYLGTRAPSTTLPKRSEDMVVKGFQNEKSPAQIWAEKHQKQQPMTSEVSDSKPEEGDETDEEGHEEEDDTTNVSDVKSKFEKFNVAEPQIIKPGQTKAPASVTTEEQRQPTTTKKPIGTPLPGMHAEIENESEEEADDDDWDNEEDEIPASKPTLPTSTTSTSAAPPPAPSPRPSSKEPTPQPRATPPLPTRSTETTFVPPPPPRRNVPTPSASQEAESLESPNVTAELSEPEDIPVNIADQDEEESDEEQTKEDLPSAIADYDNEAEEHNELAFQEGDKIINIVFVDDDWWLGELESSGEKGLFPSNYVTLVE
ncbi:LADA_0F15060g1_1 [Lachancea dasiensis]|uniref:LADA_0F15060g1_1 n=1 Tax=Lachancea dasiensis TaxID=1072105 RepID=A0A1G4JNI5_9SACH|nr:LADA_0F15060g1_1 [Lachancea dasiensis]